MEAGGDLEQPMLRRHTSAQLRRQHSSHWRVPQKARRGGLDAASVRVGFVRKVYGILTAQVLTTCLACAAAMYVAPVRSLLVRVGGLSDSWWFQLLLLIPTFVALLVAQMSKTRYPTNFIALSVFTLLISLNVAMVCALLQEVGLGVLVLMAGGVTALLFSGLSAYACFAGRSFSLMGAYLSTALPILCLWGLASCMFGASGGLAYPVFGALLFSGYIVYDTWRIMEVFGCDDYVAAAIELYMDVVNLFLHILQILLELTTKSD